MSISSVRMCSSHNSFDSYSPTNINNNKKYRKILNNTVNYIKKAPFTSSLREEQKKNQTEITKSLINIYEYIRDHSESTNKEKASALSRMAGLLNSMGKVEEAIFCLQEAKKLGSDNL